MSTRFFKLEALESRRLLAGESALISHFGPPNAITNLTEFQGEIYFGARSAGGSELWKADSTGDAWQVKQINAIVGKDANPNEMLPFGASLYFVAETPSFRRNVFRTDGTEEGTVQISKNGDVTQLIRSGDRLFFTQYFRPGASFEFKASIWTLDSDGAEPSELASGLDNIVTAWDAGGTALFVSQPYRADTSIYASDGSIEGTKKLYQFDSQKKIRPLGFVGERSYFLAHDYRSVELWAIDFESESLELIATLPDGGIGASPANMGSSMYFTIGNTLWKSDGTSAGTQAVADFAVGLSHLVASEDQLFFFASEDTAGRELWASDGTTVGTQLVRDIKSGELDGIPVEAELIVSGDNVYFVADDGLTGAELWQSDGTSEGTGIVEDLLPGSDSSAPHALVSTGSGVYFAANIGKDGFSIWRTNGVAGGADVWADVGAVGQELFGSAAAFDESTFVLSRIDDARYLVKHSADGAQMIGQFDGYQDAHSLKAARDGLYFVLNSPVDHDELWFSDGTAHGTYRIDGLKPTAGSNPRAYSATEDSVYIATDLGVFRSDGTPDGTEIISERQFVQLIAATDEFLLFYETAPNSNGAIVSLDLKSGELRELVSDVAEPAFETHDGVAYFRVRGGDSSKTQIWQTDGSSEGTRLLAELTSTDRPISRVHSSHLTVVGGVPYFVVNDGSTGPEVWRPSNDPLQPTRLTSTLASSNLNFELGEFDGQLLIQHRGQSWLSDGTINGTLPIPVPANTVAYHPFEDYSVAFVGSPTGLEIWSESSEEVDFVRVMSFDSPWSGTNSFTVGDSVFFVVQDNRPNSVELWRTDGTAAGTQMVDTAFDDGFVFGAHVAKFGDYLYYSTRSESQDVGSHDTVLKRTDGTTVTESTSAMSSLFFALLWPSFLDSDNPVASGPTHLNGKLVFHRDDVINGVEPWIFDEQGARLLKDLEQSPSPHGFYVDAFQGLGDVLLVGAYGGPEGVDFLFQLTASDGVIPVDAAAGLKESVQVEERIYFSTWGNEIREVGGGQISSDPSAFDIGRLIASGGKMFYVTTFNSGGMALRVSQYDPTTGNTTSSNLARFSLANRFGSLVAHDEVAYFIANTTDGDEQIWRFDGSTTEAITSFDVGSPRNLLSVDDRLFFEISYRDRPSELWVSDGTLGDEKLVYRPSDGEFFNPKGFTAANGQLYFLNQREFSFANVGFLWTSDGSTAGTHAVASASHLSDVRIIEADIDHLSVSALDELSRRGVWTLPLNEDPALPRQGDANRDGQVDFADFLLLSANFGEQTDVVWEDGDFNADGRVDFSDFLILSDQFS